MSPNLLPSPPPPPPPSIMITKLCVGGWELLVAGGSNQSVGCSTATAIKITVIYCLSKDGCTLKSIEYANWFVSNLFSRCFPVCQQSQEPSVRILGLYSKRRSRRLVNWGLPHYDVNGWQWRYFLPVQPSYQLWSSHGNLFGRKDIFIL